jgi:hypothetical protein
MTIMLLHTTALIGREPKHGHPLAANADMVQQQLLRIDMDTCSHDTTLLQRLESTCSLLGTAITFWSGVKWLQQSCLAHITPYPD